MVQTTSYFTFASFSISVVPRFASAIVGAESVVAEGISVAHGRGCRTFIDIYYKKAKTKTNKQTIIISRGAFNEKSASAGSTNCMLATTKTRAEVTHTKTIFSASFQEDGHAPVRSSIYETFHISLHIYKLYGFAHEIAASSGNSKEIRHSNIPPVFISQCASNVIFGLIVDSQYLPLTTCFSLALISLQDTAAISGVDPSGTGI